MGMMLLNTVHHCICACYSYSYSYSSSSSLCFHINLNIKKINSTPRPFSCKTTALITNSDSFEVGRLIGTYGFINITSSSFSGTGFHSGSESDIEYLSTEVGRLRTQDVGEGSVKIRLYEGRIAQGPYRGTPVIFKVYPGQQVGGLEADLMAANELSAHASLQSNSNGMDYLGNIQILLGGFETKAGEQWLAFRNDGKYTAVDYAKIASEKIAKGLNLGTVKLWNPFEKDVTITRRRQFVAKLLQGAIRGLAYMHDHDLLHQSLGPASVVLNTMVEKEVAYLIPRLRDLAFSVDIRYSELEAGGWSPLSEQLWRRASAAGAFTPMEKRAFGIADDMYRAYKQIKYRLLENTFQLDVQALREYCLADDRLSEAVKFLDLGDQAGWDLLQAMVNRDYRERPIAEAVLKHPFLAAAL